MSDRYHEVCTAREAIHLNRITTLESQLSQAREALEGTVKELREVLHSIGKGTPHFDGDRFHERLGAAIEALAAMKGE